MQDRMRELIAASLILCWAVVASSGCSQASLARVLGVLEATTVVAGAVANTVDAVADATVSVSEDVDRARDAIEVEGEEEEEETADE